MKIFLPGLRVYILLLVTVAVFAGCHKSSDDSDSFIPVVNTGAVITDLTTTSAQANGDITNYISNTISQYGVCYSPTNNAPTIADANTALTTANPIHFVCSITGLTANTTYYLRAYETGTNGTTLYGNVIQFKTPTATFAIAAATTTYAGTGTAGYVNGAAKSALFNNPQGVAADAAGNLYVADSFNNLIRKITPGGTVSTYAGSAAAGYADGAASAARFYSPQNLALDAAGNLYVSDAGNNAIRKITPAGVVSTLAGGSFAGYVNGTGSAAMFNNPAGLTVDASGNVYVADKGNNVIREITPAGVVTTLAGVKAAGFTDGVSFAAHFNNPTGIAINSKGIIYVTDLSNNAIRQIAKDTTVTTLAGGATLRPDLLVLPASIAIDAKGNMFIVDESGRVMEITTANVLYSIAGNANTAGYADGSGTAAAFNNPQGVTTDAAGNVYVADYNNNVIRKLVVSTTP